MQEGFAGVYRPEDGLPDAEIDTRFYEGVVTRRLVAWFFDTVLIGALTIFVALLSIGLLFFIFPIAFTIIGAAYRWLSIARHSATPGMRLTGIEFRNRRGERFSSCTALAHTGLFLLCNVIIMGQIVSIIMMLVTPRKQGLPDMILGTAAINRPA